MRLLMFFIIAAALFLVTVTYLVHADVATNLVEAPTCAMISGPVAGQTVCAEMSTGNFYFYNWSGAWQMLPPQHWQDYINTLPTPTPT